MPTLFLKPGACSLASHIVLEWIGEPYEAVAVDPASDDYRRINPAAAVPALRLDDGRVVTQSAAVLRHLVDTHPAAGLAEGEPFELDRWSAFLTGDLHPAFFPLFRPDRYTTSTEQADLADVKTAAVRLVRAKLALLEARLGEAAWLGGDARTYVDAYATPMLRWASLAVPGGLADFPHAAALLNRMLADPGVARAMAAEGLHG